MSPSTDVYRDRQEAGRRLASALSELDLDDPVVLGLPRGGVPVAREVADALDAPLDVLVVRKIGAPGHEEFGVGAIGEDDVEVLQDDTLRRLSLTRDDLQDTIDCERAELRDRVERYRGAAERVPVEGRTCVVVDDGLATGVSASAALQVLRARGPARIVLAVPVASPNGLERVRDDVDDTVVLQAPPGFRAVGMYYREFGQTTHDQVRDALAAEPRAS